MEDTQETGKAYAFFDVRKTTPETLIESLTHIRTKARTPSELELTLKTMTDFKTGKINPEIIRFIDSQSIYPTYPTGYKALMKSVSPTQVRDLGYVIEASHPYVSNAETADMLEPITNGVWQTFGQRRPFKRTIVAKIDGEYMFKES